MISRVGLGVFLAVLMLVVGISSYLYLGGRQSKITAPPELPTHAVQAPFTLPGTMVVEQGGALFSLSAGRFHQLTTTNGWMQPSFMPNGDLLVIRRMAIYSDVWTMSPYGQPIKQLTNDAAPAHSYDTGDNHWAFYPRMTPDGSTIFLSYDSPKYGYEVDLSVWQMPSNGNLRQGRVWTDELDAPGYTGGDLQPIPVPGGIIYTRYNRNPDGSIFSQVWYSNRAGSFGHALTTPAEDCREPSLAPGNAYMAMICTYNQQISNLDIAAYGNGQLGPRTAVITNQLVAMPTWAPDGSGIAYFAPALAAAPFQLWFIPKLAYFKPVPSPSPSPSPGGSPSASPSASPSPLPSPSPVVVNPIQITTNDGFDATSTIAWVA